MKRLQDPSRRLFNDRIDYSKVSGKFPLPNLVSIQNDSYHWFLTEGIEEVFRDVFPVQSYNKDMVVNYISYRVEKPKYTFLECKQRGLTYNAPLKVKFSLESKSTGEIKENEIFVCDLNLMTQSGTFIVNGAERVIVSQIVRSPGSYMSRDLDKSGHYLYTADLNPSRGTWLNFENDTKNILSLRIDRQKKMNATLLLKALGLTDTKTIIDLFDAKATRKVKTRKGQEKELSALELTLQKDENFVTELDALETIFRKLKPGEPISEEGIVSHLYQKFFDPKRYDLGKAGRYKFNTKLGIYDRLLGATIAENLVDVTGEVVFEKDTVMTKDIVDGLKEKRFFEEGAHTVQLKVNERLDSNKNVNVVSIYTNDDRTHTINIVGTDLNIEDKIVTIPDIIATFSYFMNVQFGIGSFDDIDHLSNRRVRCVGELIQNQFRVGLSKMAKAIRDNTSISNTEELVPQRLFNVRHVSTAIRDFFATSQLSQFMDQVNPLAELTNKRRISSLGPGGLTRDRASFAVRDVHYSHYGRICPIETPEGQNIGLINNLACYARVNKYGFLETPYRKVDKPFGRVSEQTVYFSANEEREYVIAEANVQLDENKIITNTEVIARFRGENIVVTPDKVDYIDVSPKQIVSIAAASIPFLENDDAMRALMGANMQRQALPLLNPESPYVATGLETKIAHDSGSAVVANFDGVVSYVDSKKIVVKDAEGEVFNYLLQKFTRSNQGTCFNQTPIVKTGQIIKAGQVLADGPAMQNGELALGRNVTIAFMTWNGYNFEDAVIMNERLVKEDVYTSIHIEEHKIETRDTKSGPEEIVRDIPNISEAAKGFLDADGIVIPGAEVKEGDILVGRVTPKGVVEPTAEDKLLQAIFAEKVKDVKDTSLRVPHGGSGTVVEVKIFSREKGDELPPGVKKSVSVYIAQKRKISEGDKMSGRHGNKGVISRILPEADMPFMEDGTPVDIMLNPLGVPSRMNIGQVLEVHLGLACKKLGIKIATPVFDGMTNEEILELMEAAKMHKDGKQILFDGRTGERFDERISVGVMYMIKLVHMVDDKLHARATGPYSLVTQQPLGGKAQNGGQRFGEMEVWALEAYGAAHILQEMMTIKSDDRVGRKRTYEAIVKGLPLPEPGIPEAFKVLTRELQGLAIDVDLINQEGNKIDLDELAKDQDAEIRRARKATRIRPEEEVIENEFEGVSYNKERSEERED
ncbi:MAG TPA: DNA-directed RNA polymerase subunit beta [Bacilli bacterium]|nr:DNA-directed RNA polymerase subunit beta [Bacilli bacterium]